ncbi:MAG: exodeoxyribonuclease VII small subunit [Deltaproteobacteria bacterium]|nr:exodeoxyribonuclease VII small subunit [Deltaproteobacteria bacterium]
MDDTKNTPGFDSILKELETIVTQMEQGNMDLEKSISLFERGISLSRMGEQKLQQAQTRIDVLLKDGTTKPLEGDFQ